MSNLGNKQRFLYKQLPLLEIYMSGLGYELVREDAYRDPKVHGEWGEKKSYASANSVHKLKLAQDYSIFKDGRYLEGEEADHAFGIMHDKADKFGLAERINGDLGHFSMEHHGYR